MSCAGSDERAMGAAGLRVHGTTATDFAGGAGAGCFGSRESQGDSDTSEKPQCATDGRTIESAKPVAEVPIPMTRFFETRDDGGVNLRVRVKSRASVSRVLGVRAGELEVAVAAPPVDGAANEELVRVLSEHYDVPKTSIEVLRGQRGRSKILRIAVVPAKLG